MGGIMKHNAPNHEVHHKNLINCYSLKLERIIRIYGGGFPLAPNWRGVFEDDLQYPTERDE